MSSGEALPLASHERFRTRDVDEARAQVGRTFCPHDLRLAGRSARNRLGGVTGDVMGATAELVEIGSLALLVALR